MAKHLFNGQPEFLCRVCSACMCDDCKNIAEEYEYLAKQRGFELARVQDKIDELNRIIERQQRSINAWKEMVQLGYPEMIQVWQESEVKKAIQAGRRSMRSEMRKSGMLPEQIEKRMKSIMETQ